MRTLAAALVVAFAITGAAAAAAAGTLTLDDRVAAQRAIEEVYWKHRIWPADNPGPKPPLSAVMSDDALRAKVARTLSDSGSFTPGQLSEELARMTKRSRAPEILRELFDALGNDPELIAETLARESLAARADGLSFADVARACDDAIRSMVLAGETRLREDHLAMAFDASIRRAAEQQHLRA
jgi:hypothetical protein